MENIKFEITYQDIRKYLERHKNDENIKHREAMFVKYMKEHQEITQESLEILMCMYNNENIKVSGIYMECPHSPYKMFYELPNFNKYLSGIKNLDISGICHIMVPMLSYYNTDKSRTFSMYGELQHIVTKMKFQRDVSIDYIEKDTYENYAIAYNNEIFRYFNDINFYFSKEESRKMIQEYSCIYGEEPVKQIRKIIRERV